MDDPVLRELMQRLDRLERESVRYRQGTVSGTAPLDVTLGAASVPYENVQQLDSPADLATDDVVGALTFGHDMLVLGKLGKTEGTGVPTGAIMAWANSTPPTGWILCNGASTAAYPDLAAVVGGNVPNLVDRFPVGAGSTYNLGATGGAATHTLTTNEMPAHTHGPGASSYFQNTNNTLGVASGAIKFDNTSISSATASTGGGASHNNLPPYLGLHWIIKT